MNIKIIIAMHKPYRVPADSLYLPVHVGAAGKETLVLSEEGGRDDGDVRKSASGRVCRDDAGENISDRNDTYCELTGLYWAWKNLECDALGLVHYRRYFTCKDRRFRRKHPPQECAMTGQEAEELLAGCDVVVPARRNYYIETLYSHYAHTLDGRHLDVAREVIAEKYPEYLSACDRAYARRGGYMFNMFLMRRREAEAYCAWLFSVLAEVEARTDVAGLTGFERRIYGRVSEILFNVWLEKRRSEGLSLREVPWMYTEPVNWRKKGIAFLQAKFFGKKYEESF